METSTGTTTRKTSKVSSRRGKGLPRRAQDMSKEELLLTLQKKRECNATALKIVEEMLEPSVGEEWFLNSLQHINQSHFQDINEERAITKLCGYPLCSIKLNDIPSKQYQISTKLNKVYDIQERKNFCSNKCFRSSKFIKDQMYTSPLWLRDIEPPVKFMLIPPTVLCGGAGDEVNVEVPRISRGEIEQISGEHETPRKGKDQQPIPSAVSKSQNLGEDMQNKEEAGTLNTTTDEKSMECPVLEGNMKETQIEKRNFVPEVCFSVNERHVPIEIIENSSLDPSLVCTTIDDSQANDESQERKYSNCINCKCSAKDEQAEGAMPRDLISCTIESEDQGYIKKMEVGKNKEILSSKVDIEIPSGRKSDETKKSQAVLETTGTCCTKMNSESEVLNQLNSDDPAINTQNTRVCSVKKLAKSAEKTALVEMQETELSLQHSAMDAECSKGRRIRVKQNVPASTKPTLSLSHVEKCIQDWFTMETMCFLFGENTLKVMLEEKGESIQECYRALRSITWDQEKHERFLAICKRLSLSDMDDSKYDNQLLKSEVEQNKKPLPDYDTIRKEAETMELKIQAFYKGKMEIEEKKVSFAEDVTDNAKATVEKEPQIPLVHLHSQKALRKRILLDGFNRVLPDFLRTFGMRPSDLSKSVRGLVSTFALSATNITFRPQEWSLLGLIIIKLLALREPELKLCLEREQSSTYLTLMLMSYRLEPGYLDGILSWLTDLDNLLEKSCSNKQM